jgi:ABC-type transport system substrate-binding protein
MTLFAWRWLAASSMIAGVIAVATGMPVALAETRPQYGGTLHVSMRGAPASLDPADRSAPDPIAQNTLTLLMFDTLVALDDNGRAQAELAASWRASPSQASSGNQRWVLRLRRGVKFHDGTALTPEIAAASLRTANPSWIVSSDADSVAIDSSDPELLGELALPRNAIAKRNAGNAPSGTGPFYVTDWQPGKKFTLAAEEDYWGGRPFLDAIEVEMGKSYRDQMTALELGRADLVQLTAEQTHRVSSEGRRLASSQPIELMALVFARAAQTPEEKSLREALALSVDRGSIRNVLLQGAGQPAAALLPNWISGYAFVFSTDADLPRARQARERVRTIPFWSLGYDGNDPIARLIAERITLNARDAGLSLQPTSAAAGDIRLMRIPLPSANPWIALASVAASTGLTLSRDDSSKTDRGVEELYTAEQALLATQQVIPLFHVPVSYAASGTLKNWMVRPDGSLSLADARLENVKP